ncbi:MAG: HEAT repeat domain-containing protein [Candidatus Thorarchaeota archaeon]
MVDIKGLLKRAGKGLVIAAASVAAGLVLGPIAATAVGGFVSKRMGEVGITVSQRLIEERIYDSVTSGPHGIARLVESRRMKEIADDVAAETGVSSEEANAAVQYAFRDLQTTMGSVIHEMQNDRGLMMAALQLARETDVKIDALSEQSVQSQETLEQVKSILVSMERQLDRSYRSVMGSFSDRSVLDFDRLLMMSRLQEQNMTLSSRFDVEYDPALYVSRQSDETIFDDFMSHSGMTDRNVFLALGDVGMGKTWFLARLAERTMKEDIPTFFVPLRHGIRGLTGIFQTNSIPELVTLLDSILAREGKHAYIFLDGLDEMPSREARTILSGVSTARVGTISFVLSCRLADWTSDPMIVQSCHDLEHYIHENATAASRARSRGVSTSLSVMMSEFNEQELKAALERYGIPAPLPEELGNLLKKPFLLRLVSRKYAMTGKLPSPDSHDFLDLFAGEQEQVHTVLGRLGVITERDTLYETVEQFIDSGEDSLSLSELKELDPDEPTFRTLVSSGLLELNVTRLGTAISLSSDFMLPLMTLAILRHKSRPRRYKQLLDSAKRWIPELGQKVVDLLSVVEGAPTDVRTLEVDQRAETLRDLLDQKSFKELPEVKIPAFVEHSAAGEVEEEAPKAVDAEVPADEVAQHLTSLSDSDAEVRRAAIDALGRLREASAVEPLIAALQDGDQKVRAMAVRSLGLLADLRAVDPLRSLADTEEVQDIAIKARWAADSIVDKQKKKSE